MPKRKKKEEKTRIFLNICQEYEEIGKRKQQREQGEKYRGNIKTTRRGVIMKGRGKRK